MADKTEEDGMRNCTVRIGQNEDTCVSLYQKVSTKMHIPINWMKLVYDGKIISNSATNGLDESGLREGAEIILEYLPK